MNTQIRNTKGRGHITTNVRTYISVDTQIHEDKNTEIYKHTTNLHKYNIAGRHNYMNTYTMKHIFNNAYTHKFKQTRKQLHT